MICVLFCLLYACKKYSYPRRGLAYIMSGEEGKLQSEGVKGGFSEG